MKFPHIAISILLVLQPLTAREVSRSLEKERTLLRQSQRALLQARSSGAVIGWKKTLKDLMGSSTFLTPTATPTAPTPKPTSIPTDQPSTSPTEAPSEAPSFQPTFSPTSSPTENRVVPMCDLGGGIVSQESGLLYVQSKYALSQWQTAFSCEKYTQGSISFEIIELGSVHKGLMIGLSSWSLNGDITFDYDMAGKDVYPRDGSLLVEKGAFYSSKTALIETCPIVSSGSIVKMVFDTTEGWISFLVDGILCASNPLATTSTDGMYISVTFAEDSIVQQQNDFLQYLPDLPPKPVTFNYALNFVLISNFEKQVDSQTDENYQVARSPQRYIKATASFKILALSNSESKLLLAISRNGRDISLNGGVWSTGEYRGSTGTSDLFGRSLLVGDIVTFGLDSTSGTLSIALNGEEFATKEITISSVGYYWTAAIYGIGTSVMAL